MFRRAAFALLRRPQSGFAGLSTLAPRTLYKYTGLINRCNSRLDNGFPLTGVRYFSNEIAADWPEEIKRFLEKEKIEKPTLIQEKTLPIIMQNKDLVGIARTGSGKTLAFIIPAVMKVLKAKEEQKGNDGGLRPPTCLVLAPTRELANQTGAVIRKFQNMGLHSICLVGGSARTEQMRELSSRNHEIYVATPGRLMDLIETQVVDLSHIKYLVLDEADRMLDMGFEPQIRRIISKIPRERQTVMWSATWPVEIQSLAAEFMKSYEYVAVDSEKLKANPNIKQIIELCQPMNKVKSLINHLNDFKNECSEPRTLIFVNTKRLADTLLLHLMRNKIRATSIHGDRSQRQRDDALRMFKNRLCHTLVATDVAARGLDITDITHVVNFDFPNTIEDYIHRIGRTARAERRGTAVSLLTENNANIAGKLVKVLKETDQPVPAELEELATKKDLYFKKTSDFNNRRRRDDFYSTGRVQTQHSRRTQQQHQQSRSRFYMDEEDFDEEEQDYDHNNRNRQRSYGSGGNRHDHRRSRGFSLDDD